MRVLLRGGFCAVWITGLLLSIEWFIGSVEAHDPLLRNKAILGMIVTIAAMLVHSRLIWEDSK